MNIDIVYLVVVLIVVLVSMTLHEAMHAFASYWLGDDTAKLLGRLTLNPVKHIDPFLTLLLPILLAISGAPIFGGAKPVPFNPNKLRFGEWGVAIVAIAGPITNFIIAFLAVGIWSLIDVSSQNSWGQIFITIASINLGFFVFNMIPLPPLDGSRVIYVLAPEFVRRGMEALEQFGVIIVFAIVLVASSSFNSFMLVVINLFLNIFGFIFGIR